MPSHEVTGEVIGPTDTTIVGPQIAAQAWSSEEPPTEPEQTEHEHGWSLTWQYATALLSSGIVLAIVIWAVFYVISRGGDPTPSVPTPHTSATTPTTTPTTASPEERTARFNQAFQAVYAKPGETEPRLQDALIDDHHVLKMTSARPAPSSASCAHRASGSASTGRRARSPRSIATTRPPSTTWSGTSISS